MRIDPRRASTNDGSGGDDAPLPPPGRRPHGPIPRAIALLLIAGLAAACSIILSKENATQCQTDSDCSSIFAGSRAAVCGTDHTCVNPPNFCVSASDCPSSADSGKTVTCVSNTCTSQNSNFCNGDFGSGANNACTTPAYPKCVTNTCDQCVVDSDCPMTVDGAPTPSQCIQNQCEPLKGGTCRTNTDCTSAQSPFCVSGTCVNCEHNTDCPMVSFATGDAGTDGGASSGPGICIANTCTSLTSSACPLVIGTAADYQQDNVAVFGIEVPIAGNPNATTGQTIVNGAILTRSEFYTTFGGLPGAMGTKPRPFVYVVCNELDAPTSIAGVTHLVNDLKVPWYLGGLSSGLSYAEASMVSGPAKVANISPSVTGANTTLNNGVTFGYGSYDLEMLPLYQWAITNIQTTLQTAGTIPPNQLKVELFFRGDVAGTYFEPILRDDLTFNGQSGKNQTMGDGGAGGPFLFEENYGFAPGQSTPDQQAATTKAINDTLTNLPNVIVFVGLTELFADVQQIEMNWPTGVPKPYYLFYTSAVSFPWATWGSGVAANPSLQSRILFPVGEVSPTDTTAKAVAAWEVSEYESAQPDASPMPTTQQLFPVAVAAQGQIGGVTGYDASHLLLFATVGAAASGTGAVTGTTIATALEKDIGPPGVVSAITGVAPNDVLTVLNNAVAALQGQEQVGYYGVAGEVQFNQQLRYNWVTSMDCVSASNLPAPTGVTFQPTAETADGGIGFITGTCGGPCATACP